ncbi:MAG: citrate/2-methylcitrate synthase [Candidatus Caenarcaniphilales bacterium]|nr:citrate/2-methylcitrate synthase [Candidatus Caenarcaniphilales bacterium]
MVQTEEVKTFKTGLEDIIAGESKICLIDGEQRKLFYRGYNVADLTEHSNFEETAFLLVRGHLPSLDQLNDFKQLIRNSQTLSPQILDLIAKVPAKTHPMDMLRSAVSTLSQYDEDTPSNSREANLCKATHLLAMTPAVIAAYSRLRKGEKPIPPRNDLSLAGNFLYMLTGSEPHAFAEQVFDKCLILHADHGFNASTFTARVITATLSDMHSAVTGAIGALKGKLHGGANQDVMDMLTKIDKPENIEPYLTKFFADGGKVPGFGHRVYRNCEDPRATILREFSRQLSEKLGETKWFNLSQKVWEFVTEYTKQKGKLIHSNVDFYSASTYALLGIDSQLFTPIFVMSRMAGWCAHIIEQHENNRLIRPMECYIGDRDLSYTSISER